MTKEVSREVKTYKYKVNDKSYVEIEIENKHIESINVYLNPSPITGKSVLIHQSDIFHINQTKQFKELVDVFNEIVKDFYND